MSKCHHYGVGRWYYDLNHNLQDSLHCMLADFVLCGEE